MSSPIRYALAEDERVNWLGSIPFFLMHLLPLGLLFTGVRVWDVVLCVFLYVARMFFITAGYHRYFAHRSYKMGRAMQFLMALGGSTAAQKGVLWWASHHRDHHKFSDGPEDIHSPRRGFWWSHIGWVLCKKYEPTKIDRIKDFAKYPELRWLNRYHLLPAVALAVACYLIGGASTLFCGFFLSTVLLYHGTFTINSFTHIWGRRRYATTDDSKNSLLFALITLGEGWHNNHHYYQRSTSQGFYWWELDISYLILKALSFLGLVWGMHKPPQHVLDSNRVEQKARASEPESLLSIPPEAAPAERAV